MLSRDWNNVTACFPRSQRVADLDADETRVLAGQSSSALLIDVV